MFAKLLKHEFRASAGRLGILSLAAILAGALGGVMLRILSSFADGAVSDTVEIILGVLLAFVIIGLVVYMVSAYIMLYTQFYRNKFTDEGYLTFTLPAPTWQILLSSVLNIALWSVLISGAILLSMLLLTLIGVPKGIDSPIADMLEEMQIEVSLGDDWLLYQAQNALSGLAGIIIWLGSITLGATWAKRHPIGAAIGIYYLISMARGILQTFLLSSVLANAYSLEDVAEGLNRSVTAQTFSQVVVAVALFFLANHLLKKKLNLP